MRIIRICLNVVAGVIGVATLVVLAGHFGIVDTVKPYIVQSGSMSPAIPVGSIVLVRATPVYNQNDVITFHQNGDKKTVVTHRIIFKRYLNGVSSEPTYITNGDANKDVDSYEVKNSDIVGKVYLTVPFIGYAVDLAKTPKGFILLVIIPATIIVYEELRTVMRELAKLLGRGKNHSAPQNEVSIGQVSFAAAQEAVIMKREFALPKAAVVLPVIGAALVLIAFTGAYFLDNEHSNSNIMSASVSFPTPTSTVTPTLTPTPIATQSATPTP